MAIKFVRSISATTSQKGAVYLVSDTEPESLTITGSDVSGLNNDFVLAAGSVLRTPEKEYMAFSDGVFTEVTSGRGLSGWI